MEDYYKILELTDDDKKLSGDEFKKKVKSNYRKLSKKHHPDVGGDEEMFKKINKANEVLSDDASRSQYDNGGNGNIRYRTWSGEEVSPEFVKAYIKRQHSKVIRVNVPITTFANHDLRIVANNIITSHKCEPCNGTGGPDKKPCPHCGSTGRIRNGFMTGRCPSCNGSGQMNHGCTSCKGSGVRMKSDNIGFKVSDIDLRQRHVIIENGGNFISDDIGNADLIIEIVITDSDGFSLDESTLADVNKIINLKYYDYILGKTMEVSTVSGKKLNITIPPMFNINSSLRVRGHGLNTPDIVGDMYLHINIVYPNPISDDEKSLLEKIRSLN